MLGQCEDSRGYVELLVGILTNTNNPVRAWCGVRGAGCGVRAKSSLGWVGVVGMHVKLLHNLGFEPPLRIPCASLSLTRWLSGSLAVWLSLTHTHTHTHTLSLSDSLALGLANSLILWFPCSGRRAADGCDPAEEHGGATLETTGPLLHASSRREDRTQKLPLAGR